MPAACSCVAAVMFPLQSCCSPIVFLVKDPSITPAFTTFAPVFVGVCNISRSLGTCKLLACASSLHGHSFVQAIQDLSKSDPKCWLLSRIVKSKSKSIENIISFLNKKKRIYHTLVFQTQYGHLKSTQIHRYNWIIWTVFDGTNRAYLLKHPVYPTTAQLCTWPLT